MLGFDEVAGRWILHKIAKPGRAYDSALFAAGWTGDRITFITEALLPTGRFVAVRTTLASDSAVQRRQVSSAGGPGSPAS